MHNCRHTYLPGLVIMLLIAGTALETFRDFRIIDTHEHIATLNKAEILLEANKNTGVVKNLMLPSPTETLTLNGRQSFTGYRENVDELFRIAEKYPDEFVPFCTVSPLDEDALQYFRECHLRGGKGLKLYNGHSYYYNVFRMPLDAPRMLPVYAYAERNGIPLLFHINISKFEDELRSVLDQYPDLVVSVPHFMVSSIDLDKVMALLDEYPNLYTDISFGSPEFFAAGFRRISNDPGKYANFINSYSDRVLFGTDMVLTESPQKDQAFMESVLRCYRGILEKRKFSCAPVADYYADVLEEHQKRYDACQPKEGAYCSNLKDKVDVYQERVNEVTILNGLNLSRPILKKIYEKNPAEFLGI